MLIPESWLREWVDPGIDTAGLAERLTMGGLEVDGIEPHGAGLDGVVVAAVLFTAWFALKMVFWVILLPLRLLLGVFRFELFLVRFFSGKTTCERISICLCFVTCRAITSLFVQLAGFVKFSSCFLQLLVGLFAATHFAGFIDKLFCCGVSGKQGCLPSSQFSRIG